MRDYNSIHYETHTDIPTIAVSVYLLSFEEIYNVIVRAVIVQREGTRMIEDVGKSDALMMSSVPGELAGEPYGERKR